MIIMPNELSEANWDFWNVRVGKEQECGGTCG